VSHPVRSKLSWLGAHDLAQKSPYAAKPHSAGSVTQAWRPDGRRGRTCGTGPPRVTSAGRFVSAMICSLSLQVGYSVTTGQSFSTPATTLK
jgi:hypothetical protein